MQMLQWTSGILQFLGCLRPPSWTSSSKKFLYNMYTLFVFTLMHSLLITVLLDIVFNIENQSDFSDNVYATMSIMISCMKMCCFLASRQHIVVLLDTLEKEPFLPVNAEEMKIKRTFNRTNETISRSYTILLESCVTLVFIASLFRDAKNRKLTYRAWMPYDYSSLILYSVTFCHQVVSVVMCSLVTIGYDTLFSGLLFCINCQLDILGHRLQNLSKDEKDSAKKCARYHNRIYEFAANVNKGFQTVVCVQFLTSSVIICFNLYRITQKDLQSTFFETVLYSFCILMQIFYYCWYGNEVKRKSLEIPKVIIESNWSALDDNGKKILLMVMRRAMFPIEFTSIHVLSVNLESFMTLLKGSYSVYNLLQQRESSKFS